MIAFILGTAVGMIIGVTVTFLVLEDVDKFWNKALAYSLSRPLNLLT